MKENLGAADWAAARGEKWRGQLGGMEATLKVVDEPLIRAARLDAPYRIADVGCGGGATTLEILRRAPAGSVVHGYDISPDLIDAARLRAGEFGIRFEVADMASAAAPAGLYDRLVSRFGIMFFDDPAAAFANLYRWLAPGGRFAFAAWGAAADNPWIAAVREAVAEAIELPKPDPDAPGPFRYGDAEKLLTLLDGAGFRELQVTGWRGELPIGGGLPAARAAEFGLASFGTFAEQLAQAGVGAQDRARQALTERFSGRERGGIVLMDAAVHIFTGGTQGRAAGQ